MLKKHPLSIVAIILLLWTSILFIVEMVNYRQPAVITPQTSAEYPFGIPSYRNIFYRPLVALDKLSPNPENDADGPFAIAFLFFPAIAFLLSGIDAIVTYRRKERKKDRLALWTFLASIALPIVLIALQGLIISIIY